MDSGGNLWLFGGGGLDSTGLSGYLNDLWQYNPASNQWTWISGSDTTDQHGVYGTKGTPSSGNIPGAREHSVNWTDGSGNLWLFGGGGFDSSGSSGQLNDLWIYNPGSDQWTWISGSDTANQGGIYGTKGTPSSGNIPGARLGSISWMDRSGNLWLFGGYGFDSTGSAVALDLNDLWKYNPASGQWTWISGSDIGGQSGVYGTKGTPSSGNVPGGRERSVSWTDGSGKLWLFGGEAFNSSRTSGMDLNDLWQYDPASNQWTWISGSDTANQAGVYGTKGTPSASNIPGARAESVSWIDSGGNLWLSGGGGFDSTGRSGYLNDLWQYDPASNQWTWISGSETANQGGVYGTKGTPSAGNIPGARLGSISWIDSGGNLWLFGGDGFDSTSSIGLINDLWRLTP